MKFFPAPPKYLLTQIFGGPARKSLFLILLLFLCAFHLCRPANVFGAVPTEPTATPTSVPTPAAVAPPLSTVDWKFDQEVTNVGKSADRARQFLWWVFNKPPVHTAPVLAEIWAFSRNIVYVFVILVIVALGMGLIMSQKRGPLGPVFSGISSPVTWTNPLSILIKVAAILLYVTFSYVIILAMIQTSEIVMQFFIHNVGGQNLFNVVFSGSGNIEENYTSFVGWRDLNPYNVESAKTALFMINLTSFTYYVMGIIVVLRTIILWLLLVISPFLALLMPFVFIRNIGWIWIGVFLQWLFYGPLMAMFLSALVRIWVAGIPFPFDFSRSHKVEGQIYRTAINILYGGPAQTLGTWNSANYVDTFAEYVISLIMLWATMLLPWLLLRIFRDYCCDVIAKSNATLTSMFDRLRQYPVPPPAAPSPPSPTTVAGMAVELPFRQRVEEKIREVERTKMETIKEVSQISTVDIVRSMDMAVSSLSDISRMETSERQQNMVQKNLEKIALPEYLVSPAEREFYSNVKNELQNRATAGDSAAATILAAAENRRDILADQVEVTSTKRPVITVSATAALGLPAVTPTVMSTQQLVDVLRERDVVSTIANQVNIKDEEVRRVLQTICTMNIVNMTTIKETAQKTNIPEKTVQEIVVASQMAIKMPVGPVVSATEILSQTETIKDISQKTQVSSEKVKEVIQALPTLDISDPKVLSETIKSTGLTEEKVKDIVIAAKEVMPSIMKKPTAGKGTKSVSMAGKTVQTQVAVEDYEEVKKMWLKHYREAPVPMSENIKNRPQWIVEEEHKLTNISHLLSSTDPKLRREGFEKVSTILPFMLLGGFTDAEILTYIKAKLEAAKQVETEIAVAEKAKEELKGQLEEEETLLPVSPAKKEEKKQMVMEEEKKMEIPKSPKP